MYPTPFSIFELTDWGATVFALLLPGGTPTHYRNVFSKNLVFFLYVS